jgi:hypothetical protein
LLAWFVPLAVMIALHCRAGAFNMNLLRNCRCVVARLAWLPLVVAVLRADGATPNDAHEEKFKVLQTRTRSYTNVTVTTRADSYIFIVHSGGMENIQLSDLTPDTLKKLGYTVEAGESHAKISSASTSAHVRHSETGPSSRTARSQSPGFMAWLRSSHTAIAIILVLGLGFYLFYCYCLALMCKKAGSEPGILIWCPLLQWFPLFEAAGMSGLWFLALFVPVLSFGAVILWSINIVKAREKNILVAIPLLFLPTHFFAVAYLAFSSSAPVEEPQKYKSMALETA